MQLEGPALVAEPSQRLIPLDLSRGGACGNDADGGPGGGAGGGVCGAARGTVSVWLFQIPSLHPLSESSHSSRTVRPANPLVVGGKVLPSPSDRTNPSEVKFASLHGNLHTTLV